VKGAVISSDSWSSSSGGLLSSSINPTNDNQDNFERESFRHGSEPLSKEIDGGVTEEELRQLTHESSPSDFAVREIIGNYREFVNADVEGEWNEPTDYFEEEALRSLANDILEKLNSGCDWTFEDDTPNEMQIHCPQIREVDGDDFNRQFESRFLMEVRDKVGNWVWADVDGSPYVMSSPAFLAVSGSDKDLGGNVLFSTKAFEEVLARAERNPNLIPELLRAEILSAINEWSSVAAIRELDAPLENLRFSSADRVCIAECGEAIFLLSIGQSRTGTLAVQVEGVGFI
jgi:hypothetical protein